MDALDQGLQCSYFKNGDDQYPLYVDKVLNNDSHGSQRRSSLFGRKKMGRYGHLTVINQGSYGIVYSALDKKTGRFVAVKQEFDGLMSPSTRREIGILNSLPPHPSIVELKEAVVEDSGLVFVVMEYLPNDLKKLMDLKKSSNNSFTLGEVKRMMKQLFEGVTFLHENGVMHRDLKPSNILIDDSKGQLKICDFGLSRYCYGKASGSYTPGLVTLWYRAPELLLGAKEYSCAIDMWSVGCIMAELLLKQVLFRGTSELHQVGSIFTILGTPDDVSWPGFSNLPGSSIFQFAKQPYNDQLRLKFAIDASDSFGAPLLMECEFDLLEKLLAYDPHKRISAKAALDHDWFREY